MHSAKPRDPSQLGANLFAHETRDFATVTSKIHSGFKSHESLLARLQVFLSCGEDLFASGGIEKFEKSDAQAKTFRRRSVFELTYAT